MDIIPPRNSGAARLSSPPTPEQSASDRPAAALPHAGEPPRLPNQKSSWRSVLSTIGLFAAAFSIAIFLNTFVIQSYQVDGQSMQDTLQNSDRLIVNKVPRTISRLSGHQYVPGRSDVIIFNQAGLPGFIGEKQLIKRVIGLPGERVVVNNGRITVYNAQHPAGFDPDDSSAYKTSSPVTAGNVDVQLQPDELFVCGDNRPNSEDSRYFGPIKTNQVVAKLVLRILPLNKARSF